MTALHLARWEARRDLMREVLVRVAAVAYLAAFFLAVEGALWKLMF